MKARIVISELKGGGSAVLFVYRGVGRMIEICRMGGWMENERVKALGYVGDVCGEYGA